MAASTTVVAGAQVTVVRCPMLPRILRWCMAGLCGAGGTLSAAGGV